MELYAYEFAPNSKNLSGFNLDDTFQIITCQRSVVLSLESIPNLSPLRSFQGYQAYDYFLRFACGLESQIKGETDVFGQIKSAFKNMSEIRPEAATGFQALFQKLLEDTKELRANYLHNIGGNTYGALARRLLHPSPTSRVLVLGAGQISKSIAPYFAEAHLTIYNRSVERLDEIREELDKKGYSRIEYTLDEIKLKTALAEATLILICTPPGSELDTLAIDACLGNKQAKVFHFGAQGFDLMHFQDAAHLKDRVFSLTELFEMEKSQGCFRDRQVTQALEACRHRAILRSMSRSISLAHGWEDLMAFY